MSIYETNVLVAVVQSMKRPQSFILDKFFPNVVESLTEKISIDIVVGKRRVSPFVSPLVQGKVVNSLGRRTDTFTPPYVKDKRRLDPNAPLRRAVGEQIGGNLTPAQREQANLSFELADQLDMLTRRLELMAADALIDGKTDVSGEGFETVQVDFQRDPALTFALTGADRWGQANISPAADLEDWGLLVLQSSGIVVTDIIFTPGPWKKFKADPAVKDDIDTTQRGSTSSIDKAPLPKTGAAYKGRWGSFDLWVYNDWYIDPADNTEKAIIPDGRVIMGSSEIQGVRNFGMIMDPKNNYMPASYFPKSWMEEDPALRWLMLQAAPLPVPTNVNASLCANIDGGA